MAVEFGIGEIMTIDGVTYRVAEHPRMPGTPYRREGQRSVVHQVVSESGVKKALKAFKSEYQVPSRLLLVPSLLAAYANLPGLSVCQRTVLTKRGSSALLSRYPDLDYAMLMPWIDGPTWTEVLRGGGLAPTAPLAPEQSLALARSLAGVLARMQQHGLAHRNLSGSHLLIPGLHQSALPDRPISIELVGLEQLSGPNWPSTDPPAGGSPAYAPRSTPDGRMADRFAGAVLIAEMLGWCDERVRVAAWGDSFFNPEEMQRGSERYQTLVSVLQERWGTTVAANFRQAWHSETPTHCPPPADWMVSLLDVVSVPALTVRPEHVPGPAEATAVEDEAVAKQRAESIGPVDTVCELIRMAQQFEDAGQPVSALETYRQALRVVARGGFASRPLLQELVLVVRALEARQRQGAEAALAESTAQDAGPDGESVAADLGTLLDEGLDLFEKGEWQQAKELLKTRELLSGIVERRTGTQIDEWNATKSPKAPDGRMGVPGRVRQRSVRDMVPLVAALMIVLTLLGIAGYLSLRGWDEGSSGRNPFVLASTRDPAASQALATLRAQVRETAMVEAYATAAVQARETAMAGDLAQVESARRETAAARVLQTATAQATETAAAHAAETTTAQFLQTATAQAMQTATEQALETATAQALQTATAQALETATAQAEQTATAQALETATVQAEQTATAQALETATAQALGTATAQALQTTAAQAAETTAAQALQTAAARNTEVAITSPEVAKPEGPVIELVPTRGRVGTPITVSGRDWPDRTEVYFALVKKGALMVLSDSDRLGVSVVPEDGLFVTTIRLPAGEGWEQQPAVIVVAYTASFEHSASAEFSVLTATAAATPTETAPPSLEVSPGQVTAGAALTVHGTHWAAGSTVHLAFAQAPKGAKTLRLDPDVTAGSVTVDARGAFDAEITVPTPDDGWDVDSNLLLVGFSSDYRQTAVASLSAAPLPEPR